MKFFVPFTKDEEMAEHVIDAVTKFINFPPDAPRIYSIKYTHNKVTKSAIVGEHPEYPNYQYETIIAILSGPYVAVCTQNRGVARGVPIMVGGQEITQIEYFEGFGGKHG